MKSRQYDNEYFKGYAEEFSARLIDYDVRQLALDDVKAYFVASVPGRALDEDTAEAIRRATHGIPLAVEEAAEMWGKEFALEEIVGDDTEVSPGKQIVARMTQRYFLHVIEPNENDRYALYALVLAKGDLELLQAMLHPEKETEFVLRELLQRLERDYASVHAGEYRLHEEPASLHPRPS